MSTIKKVKVQAGKYWIENKPLYICKTEYNDWNLYSHMTTSDAADCWGGEYITSFTTLTACIDYLKSLQDFKKHVYIYLTFNFNHWFSAINTSD